MAGNKTVNYLYSVGGRIKFGETVEEAVVREVFEETGIKMEVDRLGFVYENYFSDACVKFGKLVYEISFFFYMKVPENFSPVCESFTENGNKEYLKWVSFDENVKIYPEFFKSELKKTCKSVKHFVFDGRKN